MGAEVTAEGEQATMYHEVRASDAERDRVVERLRHALSQGRLTLEEYDSRVAAAYQAKTRGELTVLTRDLPGSLW